MNGTGIGYITQNLFDCPVCKKPIDATVALSIESGAIDVQPGGAIDVKVHATGLKIDHECTPVEYDRHGHKIEDPST